MNVREHVTVGITAKKFYQKQNSTLEVVTQTEDDTPFSFDDSEDPWADDDEDFWTW